MEMDATIDDYSSEYEEDVEQQSLPLFRLDNAYVDEQILAYGSIVCLSVSNRTACIGTSKACLIRYNLDRDVDAPSKDDFLVMDLNAKRWGEQTPHKIFMDITSRHTIVTLKSSAGGSETFYHFYTWENPQPITRLKNFIVNAVSFQKLPPDETSTREILVGTTSGQLYEMLIEEKDKREKYLKLLYEFGETQEPICDIQHEKLNNKIVVMVTTFTRLYLFSGFGTFEATFSLYTNRVPRITEIPNSYSISKLSYFPDKRGFDNFSWLCGSGIFYGLINFNFHAKSMPQADSDSFIENKHLLEYAKFNDDEINFPIDFCVSEHHFLVMYKNKIKIISRVNLSVVQVIPYPESDSELLDNGNLDCLFGLSVDHQTNSIFVHTSKDVFLLLPLDESRDLWKIYLDLKDYASALENCRDGYSRDCVFYTQAENAFSDNRFEYAAQFYAKVVALKTFEEISLKFLSANQQDALRTYLLYKLDNLPSDKKSQLVMVATWLVELYLDKMNKILLNIEYGKYDSETTLLSKPANHLDDVHATESRRETVNENGGKNSALNKTDDVIGINADHENLLNEYNFMKQEFHAFLTDNQSLLDELTTIKLLSSYGREEELLLFSKLKHLHENVIQHYIRQGDAIKALAVFQDPNVPIDLQYKFGPFLMKLDAKATVDNWLLFSSKLNPSLLLPSLLRYANSSNLEEGSLHVVRYLEHCVYDLKTEDKSIHNLLLSLFAKQEDETKLIKFLHHGKKDDKDHLTIFYDPKYALKLCLKERKLTSCIHIYSLMKMQHEAVALALQIDINIAKEEANKVDDLDLKRKLWLMIARYVIEEKGIIAKPIDADENTVKEDNNNGKNISENIRKSISLLKETDGLLKLEDILPFFPDFVLIDDFKDAICESLKEYNLEIESLKSEMDQSAKGAEKIRNDIKNLNKRFTIIKKSELCEICKKSVISIKSLKFEENSNQGLSPFYVFPCSHSFHSSCLLSHVLQYSDNERKIKIQKLRNQLQIELKKLNSSSTLKSRQNQMFGNAQFPAPNSSNAETIRAQLDDFIASECPFCGELMISIIDLPFVGSEDEETQTWALGT